MRRKLLIAALSSCALSPLAAAQAPVAAPSSVQAIAYPQTRRVELIEDHFGIKVADPYRWLENDVRTDAEVKSWVDQQNAATQTFLSTLPGRDQLKARLTQLFDYERFA